MVGDFRRTTAAWALLAVEPAAELPLEQLDVRHRAFVIGVLISLVLIGLLLVASVMLGANWVRRLARHGHGPTRHANNAANTRLREALRPILPEGKSGETIVSERGTDETVVDR